MSIATPRPSLYDRIGGEAAIAAAADLFYSRVSTDALTKPFFEGLNMGLQARKLVGFLAWAFGGPGTLKGRDLRSAHLRLVRDRGLSDVHFDAVAGHLESTLRELGVAPDMIAEALAIVATTRNEVLDRASQ